MHRPRSQKRTGRATVLQNLSRRLVIILGQNDHKILKRPVLQHKRRTSAVPGTDKKKARHALAPALMHRPRSQKRTGRATVLRKLSRRLVIFWQKKMTKNLEKRSPRPSVRLDASTEITKKNRQSHRATETSTPYGHFFWQKKRHALASALMHRPRSQKRTGRATVLLKLSRHFCLFGGQKMTTKS